ncbi:MAG: hypothetical protein RLP15_00420 [Cryomorphaceae bacterium]
MSTPARETVIIGIRKHLLSRLESMHESLLELQTANASNSKSTAGDKHDTERAMNHMEMATLSQQVDAEKRQLHELEALERSNAEKTIAKGSIVRTQRHNLFIGLAFGSVDIDGWTVTGISIQSPLGNALLGLSKGEQCSVNGMLHTVEEVI